MRKPNRMDDTEFRQAYMEAALESLLPSQLRFTRTQRELTQGALALKAGVSLRTIQRLECQDLKGIKLATLVKIAHALDICLTVQFTSYTQLKQQSNELSEFHLQIPPYTL